MTLDQALSLLPDAVQHGDQWQARCPAHEDDKASLSIREGRNGQAMLYCHAGCPYEGIKAVLGLSGTTGDSRAQKTESARRTQWKEVPGTRKTVARYGYRDEQGRILYQVARDTYQMSDGEENIRFAKDFTQRTPDGNGGFVYRLDGVRRVPFRLPEVQKAIEQGKRIYWTEGEKDALNLVRAGLEATTTAQGANGYRVEYDYPQHFAGANVVVLPDNDEPGRAYAQTVAASLQGIAASVRILELPNLPDKGDVSDYLQAGGTIEQIEVLADAAPEWKPKPVACEVARESEQTARKTARIELHPDAFYGLAGEIVRALDPHTESDPSATLFQLLAAFGNVIGRTAFFRVEGDRHHTNLFVAIVGQSAKGRKGTSWGHVRALFESIDPVWTDDRVQGGLSSGEGLIHAVRDEDPPTDRRLLTLEPEFASVLRVMEREGNTISARLRDAWDGRTLRVLTKNTPLTAKDAHISLIGHITKDELLRYLQRTETVNGFANRVLWVSVQRSKLLPEGGDFLNDPRRAALIDRLHDVVHHARHVQEVKRDNEAREIWRNVYPHLSREVPGLFGAVTSRAEAQVTRLSLLFALLDGGDVIRAPHLRAALAVWTYCEESARRIFGDATGDATADKILAALRESGEKALTRTEISSLFRNNKDANQITRALKLLQENGLAERPDKPTEGRPVERWQAKLNEINEKWVERDASPESDSGVISSNSFISYSRSTDQNGQTLPIANDGEPLTYEINEITSFSDDDEWEVGAL